MKIPHNKIKVTQAISEAINIVADADGVSEVIIMAISAEDEKTDCVVGSTLEGGGEAISKEFIKFILREKSQDKVDKEIGRLLSEMFTNS